MLKTKLRSGAVKLLYDERHESGERTWREFFRARLSSQHNLAGRGTDIQTDEIERCRWCACDHHVLARVTNEWKIRRFGRTARQGKRGTGIMILNAHNLVRYLQHPEHDSNLTNGKKSTKKQRRRSRVGTA